jgi:predicted glycoside hydrolase/deacetylase ChbG (UPF0249 family)
VPRLIVNADDFGLTCGINRAILELHKAGVVTSATLMVRAPATEDAIHIARATPTLGVGCHIVLLGGTPVLPPQQVSSLVDPATGGFLTKIAPFVRRLFTGRIRSFEVEAEVTAQIRFLQGRGLSLTHVDAHKHVHAFPQVLRPILRAARACGISRIRNPFEPLWAIRATTSAGFLRAAQVCGIQTLHSTWSRILAEEGFATTEGTLAVTGTGVLDEPMLRRLLAPVPEGTWELVTHPGYNDADLDRIPTRLRASRETERRTLLSLAEFPLLDRVSFAALDGRP